MNNQAIARNYAQAFFSAALDSGKLEQIRDDLDLLRSCIESGEALIEQLSSPGFSKADRLKIIQKAIGDHLSELTRNFLFLIVNRGRQHLLSCILEELNSIIEKSQKIQLATLTSARQLTDVQQQKLQLMLQKKTGNSFRIQFRTDPKLLAGFVLVYGETMYDCSTISALNGLRDNLKSLS